MNQNEVRYLIKDEIFCLLKKVIKKVYICVIDAMGSL